MAHNETTAAQAAANANLGRPTARKSGRDARWPYVPVVVISDDVRDIECQVRGLAYATRSEAIDAAEKHIARERAELERKLSLPNYRALRAQYGVTQ